ncbi:hypothetical protein KP509_16G047500 [Ceratopteris richardii]|uniref:FLZ-type domain-containing protein n=1 Tax=Ceratopteris richardii TaxID=49495 RepID=A0A8T2T492_CERRI|nr:hypothetical protein KP509_16G047500 [Ceratopteris richardii]
MMLGKRFRRTTSVSQFGSALVSPAQAVSMPAEEQQQQKMAAFPDPVCLEVARPFTFQVRGDCLSHDCGRDAHTLCIDAHEDASPEAMDVVMEQICPSVSVPGRNYRDIPGNEQWPGQVSGVCSSWYASPQSHQMRPQSSTILQVSSSSHGNGVVEQSRSLGFLEECFLCKRRLRHERDIFIYRGDTAFCSEECRHRQILSYERRSARGASGKRGTVANSSSAETTVAA